MHRRFEQFRADDSSAPPRRLTLKTFFRLSASLQFVNSRTISSPRYQLTFLHKKSGFMRLADEPLLTCCALPAPGRLY